MRNPKDVVCSMHSFMYALMPDDQRDWEKFVKFFTSKESKWYRRIVDLDWLMMMMSAIGKSTRLRKMKT